MWAAGSLVVSVGPVTERLLDRLPELTRNKSVFLPRNNAVNPQFLGRYSEFVLNRLAWLKVKHLKLDTPFIENVFYKIGLFKNCTSHQLSFLLFSSYLSMYWFHFMQSHNKRAHTEIM